MSNKGRKHSLESKNKMSIVAKNREYKKRLKRLEVNL